MIFTNDTKGAGEGDEASGHDVSSLEADLLVEEVTKVIEAARAG